MKRLAPLLCLVLFACPAEPVECIEGTEETCDAGSLPPDFCNSAQEALSDVTNCQLTVTTAPASPSPKTNVFISRLPDGGPDFDWYLAQMPSGLTARSLLHVSGGYTAPQTAVAFSLSVLNEGPPQRALITGIDDHGAAAPKPVDLILPFSESNAKLFILVSDYQRSGQAKVDNRNPYSLSVEVLDNPDVNEPNDAQPTPIALSASSTGQQGTGSGFLATDDDVDRFTFPVSGGGRQIIYVHVTEMGTHPTNPPPPYRLSFTLTDPDGTPIAEGTMENNTLPIDLATARLSPKAGTYALEIKGYKPPNATEAVNGDLRVKYLVDVQVLPDLDTQEPNDTLATAKAVTLTPNGAVNLVTRLSYVADEEWFSVTLAPRSTPSTFRYRVRPATSGGRFNPLSGTPARQVRVTQPVTAGATAQDRQVACTSNATLCPKGPDYDRNLIDPLCKQFEPPQCLYAQRNEDTRRNPNLRHFVGAIPIAASSSSTTVNLMFRDEGLGLSKYADDREVTLELEWVDDADEASRLGGPAPITLDGTPSVMSGELTYGYGLYLQSTWLTATGNGAIRGAQDYDAYESDSDRFRITVADAGVQSWSISWEIEHGDAGSPPGELALGFVFCDGAAPAPDGGLCLGARQRIVAYNGESLTPWYLTQSAANGRMLFTKAQNATSTTFTVSAVSCACLSDARTSAGLIYADLAAVHRTSNAPLRYRVTQSISAYPPPGGTLPDGGAFTCPVTDAGCGFAR